MLLTKHVYTNEDGRTGILSLVTSDLRLEFSPLPTIAHERWQVAEWHRSLKHNPSPATSPTRTVTSQTNHFFAAVWADVTHEGQRRGTKLNHDALKTKLYVAALKSAFE